MGFEDRPYYRDRPSPIGGPLMWLLSGSVPLGTWFGIRVRLHASMVVLAALTVLFPGAMGGVYGSLSFLLVLFGIVLLHEFGHCFGSRSVGGDPRDILITPLGGLAFADAPKRPWATFWTVLCGPLVNVGICLICASILAIMGAGGAVFHVLPWNLFHVSLHSLIALLQLTNSSQIAWWTWWIFSVSYAILLFNLLPIFPLDGGQMLQSLLWVKIGYYRSMKFACTTGIIGAILVALLSIASRQLLLFFIALTGFMTCIQIQRSLAEQGYEPWQDSLDETVSGSLRHTAKQRKPSRIKAWWSQRQARALVDERETVDRVLQKVHTSGMNSLTASERRALANATESQRRREKNRS